MRCKFSKIFGILAVLAFSAPNLTGCYLIFGGDREPWVRNLKHELKYAYKKFFIQSNIKEEDNFDLRFVLEQDQSPEKELPSDLKDRILDRQKDISCVKGILSDKLARNQRILAIAAVIPAYDISKLLIKPKKKMPAELADLESEFLNSLEAFKKLSEQNIVFSKNKTHDKIPPECLNFVNRGFAFQAQLLEDASGPEEFPAVYEPTDEAAALAKNITSTMLKYVHVSKDAKAQSSDVEIGSLAIRVLYPNLADALGEAEMTNPLLVWDELSAVYSKMLTVLELRTGVQSSDATTLYESYKADMLALLEQETELLKKLKLITDQQDQIAWALITRR